MVREFICIICPNGCRIEAEAEGEAIRSIIGAACARGKEYVSQELIDPRRNISTSVLVTGGVLPLTSVRLTNPIPKKLIFQAMDEIKKIQLKAPVKAGTVIIHNLLGEHTDVIVTKEVSAL